MQTTIRAEIISNFFIKTVITAIVSIAITVFLCSNVFALSISKEREIAVEFMEAIERQNKIIKDPMASALVSEIGEQILKAVPPQPFRFSFYVMDEDQFNAFAGPGSNIFVHRGLITSLDNVDELAGIIGHEIAHSSCRHISSMVDQSKVMTIGTLAGVLAGVLLGAAGGSGGGAEFGQAVLVSSVAASQTAMLAYSRENETEADQKGLVYLTNAGFDPKGLLTGLEKIRSRDWFGSETIPDYMKTHPGSTERIVYIQSWIEGRGKTSIDNPKKSIQPLKIDPFRFEMLKCRLAGMYGNQDDALTMFNEMLNKEPDNISANYGMALLMERKSRLDDSIKYLRKALESRAFDPYILLQLGRMNILKKEPQKAIDIMQGLETFPEVETEALFYLSQARLNVGMADIAEIGFEKVINTAPKLFPKAYYHLAEIKGKSSNREDAALSHYYLGIYYYEMQNIKSAKFHLMKSLETLSDKDKQNHAQLIIAKSELREREEKRESRQRRR